MNNQNVSSLDKCLACDSTKLSPVLDLGKQPLANSFKKNARDKEETYPLAINKCDYCFHVQLSHIVDPEIIYKDYAYVSGTSDTMRKHFEWFARWSVEYYKLTNRNEHFRVLDIGCNDGSQLDAYKALDSKIITFGVDPAENLFPVSSEKGHKITCSMFDANFVRGSQSYEILVAQNVFAHQKNPLAFLQYAKQSMHYNSLLFIQTSQADMIRNAEYDTIYHEHISFYNINSMNRLCNRAGMKLVDVIKCPLHGNSYIFVLRTEAGRPNHIDNLIDMEKDLLRHETYVEYAHRCKQNMEEVYSIIEKYRKNYYPIIGYGAAAKGNTLINSANLYFDCIIDDNPLKQGKFTPGANIPVFDSGMIEYHKSPVLFVPLAWNFFDEIKSKIKAKRPYAQLGKDFFLRVNPKIEVIQ